jgi:hypothetical protein
MMPLLILVSLGAVWTGMLNAQRRYLAPAYAPAMFNVVSVLVGVGLWLAGAGGMWAVTAWSVGTLAAGVAQSVVLLPPLWRLGYRPHLRPARACSPTPACAGSPLMLPAVVGVAAVQVNIFVNTRFAASLGDGPVAQLEYAFRIFFLPIGIFGVALATVTTTQLSEEAARGDRGGLVHKTGEGLSAVWLLTAASTVGLVVLAEPIVSLIYEGGRFTAADTTAVAAILRAYALGLVPYSMVKIVAPAFYAIDRPRLPLLASLARSPSPSPSTPFYRQLGAPGLALGTSARRPRQRRPPAPRLRSLDRALAARRRRAADSRARARERGHGRDHHRRVGGPRSPLGPRGAASRARRGPRRGGARARHRHGVRDLRRAAQGARVPWRRRAARAAAQDREAAHRPGGLSPARWPGCRSTDDG